MDQEIHDIRDIALDNEDRHFGDEEFVPIPEARSPIPGAEVMDIDEAAELSMMRDGLVKSQIFEASPARAHSAIDVSARKGSLMFSSAMDLLGPSSISSPARPDEDFAEVSIIPPAKSAALRGTDCKSAKTVLLLPFSFWRAEDKESPAYLANSLLERRLEAENQQQVPLWERTGLPKEVAELSLHFRQLLGFEAFESSPVQRLRVTDLARKWLFGEARLWADAKADVFAGKQCEWTDVHLVVFPHGAILSVTVDWMSGGAQDVAFTLADLRSWVYVAKFRSIKVGVTRGWSFGQKAPVATQEVVERLQSSLGLKLYAALYGGSCVSLGSVCNWLVMMPEESTSAIARRISRFDYCQHHTCAQVSEVPEQSAFADCLYHISRANGSKMTAAVDRVRDGRVIQLRANAVIAVSRDGRFGLEWGSSLKRTFVKQFLGVFCVLTLHCLSERTTLEKLSYLSALESQNLPAPGVSAGRTMSDKDKARRRLLALATMLVKYRSSMASDDCGGRSEFRLYFLELRSVFGIAVLKNELREELQDTLAIVESDWMEEKRNEKNSELVWKLKKDALSKRKEEILSWQKRVFDVIYSAFSALGLPFIIIANIWSMNNSDLPREVSWAYLMLGCGLVSVVLFFLIYINFNRGRPELIALRAEEQALNAIRLEKFSIYSATDDVAKDEAGLASTVEANSGRKRFQIPKWLQNKARVHAELAPLRTDENRPSYDVNVIEMENYEGDLSSSNNNNKDNKNKNNEGDPSLTGPNYLEPRRDFSMDIQRPLPSTTLATRSGKTKKGWRSWFKPSGSLAPSAPAASSSVRDGFGDLDEQNYNDDFLRRPRGFSLDLPRTAPVPVATENDSDLHSGRLSFELGGSGRFSLDRDRGGLDNDDASLFPSRGFSLDLQRVSK